MSDGSTAGCPAADVLVFFPSYNEMENARQLIEAIHAELPEADVLVVDDASPDGTGEMLDELVSGDPRVQVIHRPRKMGVGSAHKLALQHARDANYPYLITMDADFSHHPRYLRTMRDRLNDSEFVTGSRYISGGRCDYGPRRQLLSRSANFLARLVLGLGLAENTTLYRGFTGSLLSRLDIDRIRSDGYSFAVDSLREISRVTESLSEFPIHFEDRTAGDSKISKTEIFQAILTLARLALHRLNPFSRPEPVVGEDERRESIGCVGCGSRFQIEKFPARTPEAGKSRNVRSWQTPAEKDSGAYSCASHDSRNHGRILQCLQCGLVFMEPGIDKPQLIAAYTESRDESYLRNMEARVQTFDYNLSRVRSHIPENARLLDVGSHCGVFLRVADSYGMDITGLEPSAWAVEAANRVTTRPIVRGTLSDLSADLEPLDVVTMWDVLEHLYDPEVELRQINRILKPGGTLMMSTLMIDTWFPRLMGAGWPWLMDMHLFYFSDGTLADLVERSGFEIIEARAYRHIVTAEYLFEKVSSLGVPGMGRAARIIGKTRAGKLLVPFHFGDIKLFVCRKVRDVELKKGALQASSDESVHRVGP